MKQKQALRRTLQHQRSALPDRATRSVAICQHVAELGVYQAAQAIHCYLPIRSEVDTSPLITAAFATGKRVAVPLIERNSATMQHSWLAAADALRVVTGAFGTAYPHPLVLANIGDWDIIVVPLLGFDNAGNRLGYGKGYYDSLLAAAQVPTVGVAFAAQQILHVPTEPHDYPLDYIVTEAAVHSF